MCEMLHAISFSKDYSSTKIEVKNFVCHKFSECNKFNLPIFEPLFSVLTKLKFGLMGFQIKFVVKLG